MNLQKKIRHCWKRCQNGLKQIWKNKNLGYVARSTIMGLIIVLIVKGVITFTRLLRLHSNKIMFLGFVLLVLLDARQSKKTQTKANRDRKKKRGVPQKEQWKALFRETRKFGALRSKSSDIILLITSVFSIKLPQEVYIMLLVNRALLDPARGNPLRLKSGQYLPTIRCKRCGPGQEQFMLKISTEGFTPEQIKSLAPVISSALVGDVKNYAVTKARENLAKNYIDFIIEDMTIDHRLVFKSVEEMLSPPTTKLHIDKRTIVDLTTSGSIICAGKTRSGKTTGIISQLLQVVPYGPDRYWSECVIIDPKRAELSRLPYTVTVDEDGGGRAILAVVKRFADSIPKRQDILNGLSEIDGNAVHWWEAGMYPSFLFLDEFVSLRTLFPKRAEKEDPEYCLATFDALLKRIVTMGASAGCYVIISIAEASVEEGGLPAMLRSAMSTRILFRPTIPEARLLWSAEKLENLPDRTYQPGDVWFSSTDGKHDEVSFVRFPQMNFPIYKELGRYLKEYYSESGPSGEAEREPLARPAGGGPT